ncbi:hypothetical protein D3C80_1169580 [compost metagenome]
MLSNSSEAVFGPRPSASCCNSSSLARNGRKRREITRCAWAKMRTETMSSGSAPGLRLTPRRNSSICSSGKANSRGRVFSSRSRSQANSLRPLSRRSQVRVWGWLRSQCSQRLCSGCSCRSSSSVRAIERAPPLPSSTRACTNPHCAFSSSNIPAPLRGFSAYSGILSGLGETITPLLSA